MGEIVRLWPVSLGTYQDESGFVVIGAGSVLEALTEETPDYETTCIRWNSGPATLSFVFDIPEFDDYELLAIKLNVIQKHGNYGFFPTKHWIGYIVNGQWYERYVQVPPVNWNNTWYRYFTNYFTGEKFTRNDLQSLEFTYRISNYTYDPSKSIPVYVTNVYLELYLSDHKRYVGYPIKTVADYNIGTPYRIYCYSSPGELLCYTNSDCHLYVNPNINSQYDQITGVAVDAVICGTSSTVTRFNYFKFFDSLPYNTFYIDYVKPYIKYKNRSVRHENNFFFLRLKIDDNEYESVADKYYSYHHSGGNIYRDIYVNGDFLTGDVFLDTGDIYFSNPITNAPWTVNDLKKLYVGLRNYLKNASNPYSQLYNWIYDFGVEIGYSNVASSVLLRNI